MEVGENPLEEQFAEPTRPKKILVTPDLVLEWRKHYLREGHTVHSTTTYFNYLKRFVGYGIEINQKNVDRFREKNMAGACMGALKNFFKFLVDRKEFPPETLFLRFDKSKSTKKFPNSITPLEVQSIIQAMPSLKEKILTTTIYELGLRISEALKLTWQDFAWSTWLLDKTQQGSVILKETKGGKFRSIPVSKELMSLIYDSHPNRTSTGIPIGNLLFDYGIMEFLTNKEQTLEENKYEYIVVHAEDRFRKMLYKISKQAIGKRINPHMLRHSKAQDMMNHNVPIESIKRFLGHARLSSTEIYAQASAEKLKKDLEEYNAQNESKISQTSQVPV